MNMHTLRASVSRGITRWRFVLVLVSVGNPIVNRSSRPGPALFWNAESDTLGVLPGSSVQYEL
jgi:hypothetical protein